MSDYDNAELVRRVARLPLAFQPGSTWDYSISTDVLGALLEKVSGEPLDRLLQRRILGPLKMHDTAFSVPPAKQARVAQAFAVDPDTKAPVQLLDLTKPAKLLAGGAGLVSTADDYARFAQMLANGGTLDGVRILSRQSVQWMTSDHTSGVRGPAYAPGPGYGFGLGVAVRLEPGQSTIPGNKGDFHWGGYAGTFWWHDPAQGLVAAQKRDEAEANFKASRDQALAAKAQYDLARAGARSEDRSAANAQARQVAGVVAEVQAAQAETELKSPVAGEVAKVLARTGELSPQGVAVVTVVDLKDQWVVLNVREDRLQRFAIGNEFDATLPALGGKTVKFKVYHTAALPNFATWRATRAGQGFDARTFEVRARPAAPIEGARPGMTVLVN